MLLSLTFNYDLVIIASDRSTSSKASGSNNTNDKGSRTTGITQTVTLFHSFHYLTVI